MSFVWVFSAQQTCLDLSALPPRQTWKSTLLRTTVERLRWGGLVFLFAFVISHGRALVCGLAADVLSTREEDFPPPGIVLGVSGKDLRGLSGNMCSCSTQKCICLRVALCTRILVDTGVALRSARLLCALMNRMHLSGQCMHSLFVIASLFPPLTAKSHSAPPPTPIQCYLRKLSTFASIRWISMVWRS